MKIFAKTVEPEAIEQINKMANSPLGNGAHIRIMPDCHAGAGCVIGTTMKITDKVCPNLVGVDIGCGVDYVQTDMDFEADLPKLDNIIREYIPSGMNTHDEIQPYGDAPCYDFAKLRCWGQLDKKTKDLALTALGTLGGGNHFIEAYKNGGLAVHTGSRNIGWRVAEYYQNLAVKHCIKDKHREQMEKLKEIPPKERQEWLSKNKLSIDKDLCYLEDEQMNDYLHDIEVLQDFAKANRKRILQTICEKYGGMIVYSISSVHNYIEVENMILRKGAISALKGELLVIPMNMRDGLLICEGKGNEDWNYSAPHGAGRLYSRNKAKEMFSVETYAKSMEGIYTTCVNESTLDEAPFVYKNYEEIMECIEPTVRIIERKIPIYNFKAN